MRFTNHLSREISHLLAELFEEGTRHIEALRRLAAGRGAVARGGARLEGGGAWGDGGHGVGHLLAGTHALEDCGDLRHLGAGAHRRRRRHHRRRRLARRRRLHRLQMTTRAVRHK